MANRDYVTCQGMVDLVHELLPITISLRHLQDKVTRRPDFPKPYRLGAKRWWKRTEVIAWFETRKES